MKIISKRDELKHEVWNSAWATVKPNRLEEEAGFKSIRIWFRIGRVIIRSLKEIGKECENKKS